MSSEHIIGCSADGSIVGIAIIDEDLWRRLSWLQRLCEWSERLSPLSHEAPAYSDADGTFGRHERLMPVGLGNKRQDELVMRTERDKLADRHVDGDILARLLKDGDPAETLREVMRKVGARDNRAGEWMRAHMEEEMASVYEMVATLRRAMDCWM